MKIAVYKDNMLSYSTILWRLSEQYKKIILWIYIPSKPSSVIGQLARDRFSKETLFAKPWNRIHTAHYFIFLIQYSPSLYVPHIQRLCLHCKSYSQSVFTFVKVMRSLSLNGSPLRCRVLRLGETVRHSLRALHNLNVMSLDRMAGIFFLKVDL